MPKIVDPDLLRDGTEIRIHTSTRKIQLVKTGNLTDDGVTLKCVYSKLKELWKEDPVYIKYPFPMVPITDEQFEIVNGWDWYDDTTRYLIRDGGWALKDASGNSLEEWACIITLGDLTGQAYFQQYPGGPAVNFQLEGPVNQAIKIYGDKDHGNFDYRGYLRLFCRKWGYYYAYADLDMIGVTQMTYQAYRFPLSNAPDPKITHTEEYIDNNPPYVNMSIRWYTVGQSREIGENNYTFHVIIDGAGGTAEQIYEFVQAQLRKNIDIDAGPGIKVGNVTRSLLKFIGDTLYTMYYPDDPAGGVFIDNFSEADINRMVFVDDTNVERTFPYTAVLRVNFGDNLKNDPDARYWVFFTDVPSGSYGSGDAILVNTTKKFSTATRARSNNVAIITTQSPHGLNVGDGITVSGLGGAGYNGQWYVKEVPDPVTIKYDCPGPDEEEVVDTGGVVIKAMSEYVRGRDYALLTFDYDYNNQGGRTPGTDAPVTAVAIGLATAQFVKATGVIQRSVANVVTLIASLERNYANP
ncbi:MAG: hypothetical protein QXR17_08715 [Candidatus Bathyarchaeia archaeon]